MALTDILNKLGGQNGVQGGLAAISKLFEGDGMQGILTSFKGSHRVVISVTLLRRSVALEIERSRITPLGPAPAVT